MPREGTIRVGNADLYYREIGRGPAVIVLHGGPDFDHAYFLPDLDRLATSCRLIYYDQRGRGRSAAGVEPEEVTLASEMADLDAVRAHFGLDRVVLLGHSFGTVLALEYATRHPERVSHLVLMNPAPVSREDFLVLRRELEKAAETMEGKQAIAATREYRDGDPATVAAYYRIHFRPALARPEDLERLLPRLMEGTTPGGILKARAIEQRLYEETWLAETYDLLPQLANLEIPTLVLGGEHDFIPRVCAEHIVHALPNARYEFFPSCGHFAFLECPTETQRALDNLLGR